MAGKMPLTKGNKTSKLRPDIDVKVDELFLTWVNLPGQNILEENLQAIKNNSETVEKNILHENNHSQNTEDSRPVLSPRRLNNSFKISQHHGKSESRRSSSNSAIEESVAKELNKTHEVDKRHHFAAKIPTFYFPNGRPRQENELQIVLFKIKEVFTKQQKQTLTLNDMPLIAEACGCPMYWKSLLFNKAKKKNSETVNKTEIIEMWRNVAHDNHDDASRFLSLLCPPSKIYLEFDDFLPFLKDIVSTHPGLNFLRDAPEFHTRYMNTVIARIFYTVNRSWSGKITVSELRKSNFLNVLKTLEEEPDINAITDYFSYEHFYVIYCKFWELDVDHNLIIDRNDLIKHGDGVLSMRLIDRVLSGAVTRSVLKYF